MNKENKIVLSILFSFILFTSSIPLSYISQAYAQTVNNDPNIVEEYELEDNWNAPTAGAPWPEAIISENFPLRDDCINGEPIPKKYLASFKVHAIPVDIVYNAFGTHDPEGAMYVLEQDIEKVLLGNAENPGKTNPKIQPLAIRSNIGQCVEIIFTNDLVKEKASIHPTGLGLDPNKSDGTFVGLNEDSTVLPGETTTYRWFPDVEGAFFFTDAARQSSELDVSLLGAWAEGQRDALRLHGLFGALIVEPQYATWRDPFTGGPLASGVKADIIYPDSFPDNYRKDTREFLVFYHDGAEVQNADGTEIKHFDGTESSLYTINYRGDHEGARLDPANCPPGIAIEVCTDPQYFYNSWIHGDPGGGDLVFPAYSGDPIRFILVGAQVEESHVHHLHEHRWKADPSNGNSYTIDSQTIAPGAQYQAPVNWRFGDSTVSPDVTYSFALEAGGAGYQSSNPDDQGFTGDVLFHCHLFPHYGEGMWAFMRVLDRQASPIAHLVNNQLGNSLVPVGPTLLELPDFVGKTPLPTPESPGFPYFIESNPNGSPKTTPDPNGVGRDYTTLEWRGTNYYERALNDGNPATDPEDRSVAKPGGPYDDPCPPGVTERDYNVVVIKKDIVYNKYGDHDPDGRMFVLAEEADDVINGIKDPEPLTIRAEMGECVQITLENRLPVPNSFDPNGLFDTISMHVHFVGFDVLGSDGLNTGYNYHEATQPGEKVSYRWYADEQGNIFWHDHISGIAKGMHGTFGMFIVEPPKSKWLDPKTGNELPHGTGTEIMVTPEDTNPDSVDFFTPFREYAMHYHDFTELYDKDGKPIFFAATALNNGGTPSNGPILNEGAAEASGLKDKGVMGINYRNEPLWQRMKNVIDDGVSDWKDDPAYIFSSHAHGDPSTPIFKAFGNDPIKIRLIMSGHEEQHNMVFNGLHPVGSPENVPPFVGLQSQTIGTSEQFTFDFLTPVAVQGRNDYMYSSFPINDLYSGMWGFIRVWCDPTTLANDGLFGIGSQNPVQLAQLPGIETVDCSSKFSGQSQSQNLEFPEKTDSFSIDSIGQQILPSAFGQEGPGGINVGEDVFGTEDPETVPENPTTETPNTDIPNNNTTEIPNTDNNNTDSSEQPPINTGEDTVFDETPLIEEPERTILLPDPFSSNAQGTNTFNAQVKSFGTGTGTPLTIQSFNSIAGPTNFQPKTAEEFGISPTSCPDEADKVIYEAVAIRKNIELNDNQDNIPDGIVFVLKEDLSEIQSGEKDLEPFVIRANLGECVVLKLENQLPVDLLTPHQHPLQQGECNEHVNVACVEPTLIPTSNRVSLHPDNLFYDAGAFDGTNLGFNLLEQTVGPGETITYEWYTPSTGTNVLTDTADIRGHRHHGAYGMIIVEPKGAEYRDINSGDEIRSGPIADIVFPDKPEKNFREFAVLMADSQYIINPTGLCLLPDHEAPPVGSPLADQVGCNQRPVNDPEDQGFVSINYRSEPFLWRLLTEEDIQRILNQPPEPPHPEDANAEEELLVQNAELSQDYIDDVYKEEKDYVDSTYGTKDYKKNENVKEYPVPEYLTDYYPFESNAKPPELPGDDSTPEEIENGIRLSTLLSGLQSSVIHGDPDTPILKVAEGTPTVVRVAHVGDSNRGYVFHLAGHSFDRPAPIAKDPSEFETLDELDEPYTLFDVFLERGSTHAMTPGRSFSLELLGGAGGLQDKTGDYLYQDMKLKKYVESGAWGIMRVFDGDLDPVHLLTVVTQIVENSVQIDDNTKTELIQLLNSAKGYLTDGSEENDKQACEEIIKLLKALDTFEQPTSEIEQIEKTIRETGYIVC